MILKRLLLKDSGGIECVKNLCESLLMIKISPWLRLTVVKDPSLLFLNSKQRVSPRDIVMILESFVKSCSLSE